MANQHKDSSEKPSLEEVLRFKRAERPTEVFWDRFDQELHQRMLQTLVKKDPWPVQILRGLTGRIAQVSATAAAIAFLAVPTIRPAFVATEPVGDAASLVELDGSVESTPAVEEIEFAAKTVPVSASAVSASVVASADYGIDTVLAADVISTSGVTQEFEMDSIQVAAYDAAVYTADRALGVPSTFASAGVALVF